MNRAVDRYVDSLLRRRRPKAFAPSQEDLAAARTAIDLLAQSPDAYTPSVGFVDVLRRRIADQEDAESADPVTGASEPKRDRRGFGQALAGRRTFLQAGALTATGAAAGIVAEQLLSSGPVAVGAAGPGPTQSPPDMISPAEGTWQTVASTADLSEGGVMSFDQGAVSGFLRRVSGRVQAVSGTCTHQACRLALNPPRDKLVCPCHGATFTIDGANLTHPHQLNRPLPALPRLAVREVGGEIQIYAPAP